MNKKKHTYESMFISLVTMTTALVVKMKTTTMNHVNQEFHFPPHPRGPSDETPLLPSTHSSWAKADWKKPSTPTLQKTYPGTCCLSDASYMMLAITSE